MALPERLLKHLADMLGEERLVVTDEIGGEHRVNYIIQGRERYVVRAFAPDEAGRADKEYNLLARMHGDGAPKVYLKDVSEMRWERPFFIEEFLDGQAVHELSADIIAETAKALRNLHDATENAEAVLPFISDWTIRRLLETGKRTPYAQRLKNAFVDTAEALTPELIDANRTRNEFCWLHGDPTMPNLLRMRRGVVLVDWEFTRIGHRYEDLAAFIMENRLSPSAAEHFLKHYGKDIDRERLEAFSLRRLLDAVAWAVEQLDQGGSSVTLEENLERLERALSQEFPGGERGAAQAPA